MSVFTDLTLLRAFIVMVESGSLTAAARKLGVTQPTVSRQLQCLEELSGSTLLRRDTHRMSLTEPGHRLLADARALLSLAEEAEQRLRQDQGSVEGGLKIFSTIDFGQTMVARLIASFLQAHPGVTIDLAYSNRPLRMIEEGCDAGIIAGALTDDGVVAKPLGMITRGLFAAPELLGGRAMPSHPEDLRDWPWMALASAQFGGAKEVRLRSSGGEENRLPIRPRLTAEGVTSLREAARMGLGVMVLPEWMAEEDLISGRLIRLLPDWRADDLPAHLVYPADRRLPLRVRRFIAFAADYMATALKPQLG